MASLSPDSPLQGLRGKLGGELVFKRYGQKTVVSKYPDMSRVKPSAAATADGRSCALCAVDNAAPGTLSPVWSGDASRGERVSCSEEGLAKPVYGAVMAGSLRMAYFEG